MVSFKVVLLPLLISTITGLSDQQSCYTPYTSINPSSDGSFTDTSESGVQLLFPDITFNCSGHITGIDIAVKAASHTIGRSLVFQLWERVDAKKSLYMQRVIQSLGSEISMPGVSVEIVSQNMILPVQAGDIIGMYVAHESLQQPLSPMYSTVANTSNSSTVYIAYTDILPCNVALCNSNFQLLESIQYNFAINFSLTVNDTSTGKPPVCNEFDPSFKTCPINTLTISSSITVSTRDVIPSTYSSSLMSSVILNSTCVDEVCSDNSIGTLPIVISIPVAIVTILCLCVFVILTVIVVVLKKKRTEKVSSIKHYHADNGSIYAEISGRKGSKRYFQHTTPLSDFGSHETDGLEPYAELRTSVPPDIPPQQLCLVSDSSSPCQVNSPIISPYAASMTNVSVFKDAPMNSPKPVNFSSMFNLETPTRRATVSGGSPFSSAQPYVQPFPTQRSTDQLQFSPPKQRHVSVSVMTSRTRPTKNLLPILDENSMLSHKPPSAVLASRTLMPINDRKMSMPTGQHSLKHNNLRKARSIDFVASPYLEPSVATIDPSRSKLTTAGMMTASVSHINSRSYSTSSNSSNGEYSRLNRAKDIQRPSVSTIHSVSLEDLYDSAHPQKKYREIPRGRIRLGDKIGSGHFGNVFKGLWDFEGGCLQVAVKVLKPDVGQNEQDKFLQEAATMGQFYHENVVQLHGVTSIGKPLMICLELMEKGDLRHYVKELRSVHQKVVKNQLQYAKQFLSFCRQVASGMCYLASKDFVHRDLAARNIFINDQMICKIGDFGMSRDVAHDEIYQSNGLNIPLRWTAPEAVNYLKYTIASDVWSYGMLLFEIWSLGCKPFHNKSVDEIQALISSSYCLPPPPGCPKSVYKLMIQCWNRDPSSRPAFSCIVDDLSIPDSDILVWNKGDFSISKLSGMLGAHLDEGRDLFPELQNYYNDCI